jgi:hypothetical protein
MLCGLFTRRALAAPENPGGLGFQKTQAPPGIREVQADHPLSTRARREVRAGQGTQVARTLKAPARQEVQGHLVAHPVLAPLSARE